MLKAGHLDTFYHIVTLLGIISVTTAAILTPAMLSGDNGTLNIIGAGVFIAWGRAGSAADALKLLQWDI